MPDLSTWIEISEHEIGSLVGSLFYDAFARLASMLSEWLGIGKELVDRGRGLILVNYPGIRLEELSKTTKNINQDSQSPGPRIESGTSWIRKGSVNHSTNTDRQSDNKEERITQGRNKWI
jgi:hypothetical protein